MGELETRLDDMGIPYLYGDIFGDFTIEQLDLLKSYSKP